MAATLIVGLGGIGGRVIRKIAARAEAEGLKDVEFVVMDTDVNDLRTIKAENPNIFIVQTSPTGTVGAALDQNHFARDQWFPVNDGLTGKPFTEGAGQVRAVSRLAFDHAVAQGFMSELEKAIEKLHGISGENMRQAMRIMIVGSNNGGTGSGLVLPVAMFIRNFLITRYQDNSAIIRGFFVEPDTIFDRITDEEERNSLRANAYATIRELDAFFRKEYSGDSEEYAHVRFNAPQPGSGERVDYPNILPYHFVFLMDAINSEGEHLPTHEAYLEHAAACVYAQALSAVSARSNSSEDNIIRNLAANNGRSRYCGAGSAYLEYPVKAVQRFVGLKWATENVSDEWLEIDSEYKIRKRDEDDLKLRDFYIDRFDANRGNVPFYTKIAKGITFEVEMPGGGSMTVEPAREYPEHVVERADVVNEGELLRRCQDMQRAINSMKKKQGIPATDEAIQDLAEKEGSAAADVIGRAYENYFDALKHYGQAVSGEVPVQSKNIADNAFAVSDFNENPLATNRAEWQVESFLYSDKGSKVGSKHPGAVRYMLYTASIELENAIEDADSEIQTAQSQVQSIRTLLEREDDDADAAANEGKKKRGFRLPGKKETLDDAAINDMLDTASNLDRLKKAIDKQRTAIVHKAFLSAAKRYVDALSEAYEGFYKYLEGQMTNLETEMNGILYNSSYNSMRGNTHKYVCASTKCLEAIYDECPVNGDSADLPVDLCGDIYNSLLRFTKFNAGKNRKRATDAKSQAYRDLFSQTVVEFWTDRVLDPNYGYPEIVDRNVVQAIAAEAVYTSERPFLDKDAENRYVNAAIIDAFDQAYHLAAPFIEPPVGETPRTFKTCAYSEAILENAGSYFDTLTNKLSEFNSTKLKDYEYSKYSIMFYRSMYGFCADNLPKYAPARKGLQDIPEGEYHLAYYTLVNKLSPNLKENKLITPHIDKNWHLVAALPDLNETYERHLQNSIVRAYIYGLIFQQFGLEQVSTGDDIYYLKGTSKQKRTDLWVSNGTPCDRFYEVYDAMKYNPRAVNMLIERSEARMIREKNDHSAGLSIENCELVRAVRSLAFKTNFEELVNDLPERIRAYAQELKDNPLASVEPGRLPIELVTDCFNVGTPDDDNRRSILEVPLYYRISLPHTELRNGEIETMIECIFEVVEEHLGNFCDGIDLVEKCGRFFEEQYYLFEANLMKTEKVFPGIYANRAVNAVREKTLSYLEEVGSRYERVKGHQTKIEAAWRTMRG